jgi:hypothetical protein
MALVFMPVLECKSKFMEFGLKILWGMQCGELCNGLMYASLTSKDLMCTAYHFAFTEQTV